MNVCRHSTSLVEEQAPAAGVAAEEVAPVAFVAEGAVEQVGLVAVGVAFVASEEDAAFAVGAAFAY